MLNSIFNYDNVFFRFLGKIADLFVMNLIFLLCCIPVFTIGASLTALYAGMYRMVKDEEGSYVRQFFHDFKINFKKSTVIWLLLVVVTGVLYLDYRFWIQLGSNFMKILGIVMLAILLTVVLCITWIFPLLAKFENTVKNTLKNSFLFAIRYLPKTFLLVAIAVLHFGIFYFVPGGFIFPIIIGFSAMTYLQSIFIRKVFTSYLEETA